MGQFIDNIKLKKGFFDAIVDFSEETWSERLQKVKQFHGMFKYKCDSFIIGVEEFKEIFGSQDKMKIWDPEKLNKVDALEIFSGLAVFARECTFKNKLNFIFSLFDFNEIKSLSFVDVEVMALSICKSAYKIIDSNARINENEVAQWLGRHLPKTQRIKITTLYYLFTTNQQVLQFLDVIHQRPQKIEKEESERRCENDELYLIDNSKIEKYFSRAGKTPTLTQKEQNIIDWHQNLSMKMISGHNQFFLPNEQPKFIPKISWVYGINIQGSGPPFRILSNKSILYKTSSLAIRYYLDINEQEFLDASQHQIKCLAYSKKKDMVATVQDSVFTKINLWERKERFYEEGFEKQAKGYQKSKIIETNHSEGIKLAEFLTSRDYLVTIGERKDSPVVIYDVQTLEIKYKIVIGDQVQHIFTSTILIDQFELQESGDSLIFNTFFAQTNIGIYEITLNENRHTVKEIFSHALTSTDDQINQVCALYTNRKNPLIRSFKQQDSFIDSISLCLVFLVGFKSGKFSVYSLSAPNYFVQQPISTYNNPINCIRVTPQLILLSTCDQLLIYSLQEINPVCERNNEYAENLTPLKMIKLDSECKDHLLSYKIRHFEILDDEILIMSQTGEFIRVKGSQNCKNNYSLQTINSPISQDFQIDVEVVKSLVRFQQKKIPSSIVTNSTFCLLSVPQNLEQIDESINNSIENGSSDLILLTTNNNKILGINSCTHEVEDLWEIGAEYIITQLQAICADDGICYIVCACKGGKLFIRINWEESPKFYDCKSQILDIKLSKDSSYLLAATQDKHLLFFTQINRNFVSPRKIYFQNEIPRSINFLDNFKFFTVTTSAHNLYVIQIPSLKHKSLNKQTDKLYISKMNLKYTPTLVNEDSSQKQLNSHQLQTNTSLCSVIGSEMQFQLICPKQNSIYFFNSAQSLKQSSYSILKVHKCPISVLMVDSDQKKFYSLGKSDNTLIEWTVSEKQYPRFEDKRFYKEYLNIVENCQPILQKNQANTYQFNQQLKLTICSQNSISVLNSRSKTISDYGAVFMFGASKSDKMNKSFERYWKYFEDKAAAIQKNKLKNKLGVSEENYLYAMKRAPSYSITTKFVYGIEGRSSNCLQYSANGQEIYSFSSRFIIKYPSVSNKSFKNPIYQEQTDQKITNIILCQGKIVYTVRPSENLKLLAGKSKSQLLPDQIKHTLIYIHPFGTIQTNHMCGIITIKSHQQFIFSYGIANYLANYSDESASKSIPSYSINVHNFETKELLYCSYTCHSMRDFIFFNEKQMLSIGAYQDEIKLWESGNLTTEMNLKASVAALIPQGNRKQKKIFNNEETYKISSDVLLGVGNGSLVIMNQSGIFEVVRQAHEKPLTHIIVNTGLECQFITCSKDERIKVWSDRFECKIMICLREKVLESILYLSKMNTLKPQNNLNKIGKIYDLPQQIKIQSITAFFSENQSKIVVALTIGKVYEIQLFGKKNKNMRGYQLSRPTLQSFCDDLNSSLMSQKIQDEESMISISNSQFTSNERPIENMEQFSIHEILDSHSFYISQAETTPIINKSYSEKNQRKMYFSLHPQLPIIATVSCDNHLLFRNYETSKVMYRYFFENKRVVCTKFSPLGNMFVIGFDTGELCFYQLKITKKKSTVTNKKSNALQKNITENQSSTETIQVKMCQSIIDDTDAIYSWVNMQFSDCGSYFAMSVITTPKSISMIRNKIPEKIETLNQNEDSENKERIEILKPMIMVYHTRNSQIESDIKYYSLYEKLEIEGNQTQNKIKPKKKLPLKLYESGPSQSTNQWSIIKQKNGGMVLKSAYFLKFFEEDIHNGPITTSKKNKNIHLAYYEQFVNVYGFNTERIASDKKIKSKVYSLNDHKHVNQENYLPLLKWRFPHLINARCIRTLEKSQLRNQGGENQDILGETGEIHQNLNTENKVVGCQQFFDPINFDQFYQEKSQVTVTDMCIYKGMVIYGDEFGKIHLTKMSSLLPKNQYNSHFIEKLETESLKSISNSWNIGKTYCSHTESIMQMEVNYNSKYLFVSSAQNSECIVQFQLIKESQFGLQIDNRIYPANSTKGIEELYLNRTDFYDFLNNLEPIRNQIPEILMDTEEEALMINGIKRRQLSTHKYLKPIKYFGRSAYHSSKNLFYHQNTLLYPLGSNLIIQELKQPYSQKSLPSSPLRYTNAPKISSITMTRNFLFLATEEQHAHIYVWDARLYTCVGMCRAGEISIVYKMVSPSRSKDHLYLDGIEIPEEQFILIYGVNVKYQYSIQLLEWRTGKVLGIVSLPYSGGWKIRDICSVQGDNTFSKYNCQLKFVSCGVQHLALYEYRGKKLLSNSFLCPKNDVQENTTFTAVEEIKNYPIVVTSCETGNVYLFSLTSLQYIYSVKIQTCGIRQLLIDVYNTSIELLTAGKQGTIIISNIYLPEEFSGKDNFLGSVQIQPIEEYNLSQFQSIMKHKTQQPERLFIDLDIESLVLSSTRKQLYVGTRSGDIYELTRILLNSSSKEELQTKQCKPIIHSHDNNTIVNLSFDETYPGIFYLLTASGILQIWSLKTLKLLSTFEINQSASKIYSYPSHLAVVCKKAIISLSLAFSDTIELVYGHCTTEDQYLLEEQQQSKLAININFEKKLSKQYEGTVTEAIFTKKEDGCYLLVLSLKKNELNEIIINEIRRSKDGDSEICLQFILQEVHSVLNLKYEIEFMDFSIDNKYLLFKDNFEEISMINLADYKRFNTIFVEMGIEWQNEGIRISPHGQKIYCMYSRENKITKVRRLNNSQKCKIIIGDQMGTIRIYDYPSSQQQLGQLHLNCYTNHMNFINNIEVHPTLPYVLTSSVYDRAVILWEINLKLNQQNS